VARARVDIATGRHVRQTVHLGPKCSPAVATLTLEREADDWGFGRVDSCAVEARRTRSPSWRTGVVRRRQWLLIGVTDVACLIIPPMPAVATHARGARHPFGQNSESGEALGRVFTSGSSRSQKCRSSHSMSWKQQRHRAHLRSSHPDLFVAAACEENGR
jgi:hypothetical protein